jgi:biotin synthase
MPPLITREEASPSRDHDHAEIEALVERAWQARQERFGDSTDLCSLVNAKSGGCAEDCGFCAQSRFAEAETPLHALMEPEQILEHAKAAEAAGAHRFCMVTQGQGLSKRDFEKVLEGVEARRRAHEPQALRVGRAHVADARQGAAPRPASSACTTTSRRPSPTTRGLVDRPLRGPAAHDRRGPRGGPRDLRRRHPQPRRVEEQRVEMAFELASIDPTSVPINLLNPRPGRSSATATTWTRGRP